MQPCARSINDEHSSSIDRSGIWDLDVMEESGVRLALSHGGAALTRKQII